MIFLHGSNSGGAELRPFVEAMRPYAQVRTPDMLAHGGRPIPPAMTLHGIAEDVVAWMDEQGIEREVIGGYSFGGTVALRIARQFPHRVRGVVALAAKHTFDDVTIGHWKHLVSLERLERLRFPWGPRVEELTRLHSPNDWKQVAEANARLFDALAHDPPLGADDLRMIRVPVMLASSNLDPIVPWDETMALARALPDAHVAMFYGGAHPLRVIPLHALARAIDQWMHTKGLKP